MESQERVRYGRHAAALALTSVLLLIAGMFTAGQSAVAAATPVGLGTGGAFSVLGGSAVTNTGPSVISDDLGVSPQTSITGFPPGIVLGTQHPSDAVADQAQEDLTVAYNNAAGQASDAALSPDIGGQTFVSGVYTASSTLGLTGTVTLDAQGNSDAVFIFQVGSALTTASASSVSLINGADPCNVFWQIGSSATLGTNTTFAGTIMALTSVTVTTGSSIDGRALARNGAVTLDTNLITTPDCSGSSADTDTDVDVDTDSGNGTDVDVDTDSGTDTDVDVDTDSGTDTDVDVDTDSGTDTDVDVDTDSGTDTDVDVDTDSGTDTDVDVDTDSGTDTDVDVDTDSGTDTDTDSGSDSDTDSDTGDRDTDENHHSHRHSTSHHNVPKGHPRTGLGGTASDSGPLSMILLTLGGASGAGSMILVSAMGFRRVNRKRR